jgi:hypothetical protein
VHHLGETELVTVKADRRVDVGHDVPNGDPSHGDLLRTACPDPAFTILPDAHRVQATDHGRPEAMVVSGAPQARQ